MRSMLGAKDANYLYLPNILLKNYGKKEKLNKFHHKIMNSKEAILENIKKNIRQKFDKPEINISGIHYSDVMQQFIDMTKTVGGKVEHLAKGEDVNDIIKRCYPDAQKIASNLSEITIATVNPDTVNQAQDLNDTDVTVVRGECGVAENGCIWIPQATKEKAAYFICEYLVMLLPTNRIV